ncbi:hypothetical protein BV25DRAFT_1830662 [Artomyces pyxidatus]|uniref:Uncharacterized protein n=1 Tax=Artomyces pyxidatus TaxID=48021 RepID=A0ACB8SNZ1_9AGAM|nr:hypothetical protein BV25DRAFT_1830662 [Artomyces pyxidatus]
MTRAQARKEAYKKQKEGEARKAKEAKEALAAGRKARAEKRSDIREQAMERGDDGKGKAQPTAPSPPIASTFSDAADREVRISSLEEASTKTIPTPYANGRIVDFAVVNVKAGAHVERPDRYDGWRILEDHVPLLVEIKRSPPRDAQGAQFQISLRYALHEARVAVMLQAAYLFASRPHLAMVMVIAAAGPYWSTAVVLREHEFTDDELNKMLHDTEYVPEEEFVGKPSWSQPVKLYTPESNDTLKEIRTEVMSFHVMTAPEWP